ncbi:hypothetical protein GCM10027027_09860 [Neomicrococcus lactis]
MVLGAVVLEEEFTGDWDGVHAVNARAGSPRAVQDNTARRGTPCGRGSSLDTAKTDLSFRKEQPPATNC